MDEPVASFQGFGDELKVKLFFRSLQPSSGDPGAEEEQNRKIQ
jgi:hypothetical protein